MNIIRRVDRHFPVKDGRGRKPESANRSKAELLGLMMRVCGDPIEGLARIAAGDVVALGWMTRAELAAPARPATPRVPYVPSGRARALMLITPGMRLDCFRELAGYVYAKRRAIVVEDEDGRRPSGVMIYIPANGRGGAAVVEGVERDDVDRLRRQGRLTSARQKGIRVRSRGDGQ